MASRFMYILICILIALFTVVFACTQDNKDEDEDEDILKTPLLVLQDDFFEFKKNDIIGKVEFRKNRGPVGSKVEAVCTIDTLRTFLETFNTQSISVKLIILNEDAVRETYTPIEWEQDANSHSFHFYVPLVETVPVLLNYRVLVYQYDGEVDDDVDDDTDDDLNDDTDDDADDDADDDTGDDDSDDDADDDDTGDDDTGDDDVNDDVDDDTEGGEPTGPIFEAAGDFLFVINDGQPGTGD
jgi:hypothetical protein